MRKCLASVLRRLADWLDPNAGQLAIASLYANAETAAALRSELAREISAQSPESRALAEQIARYDVTPTQADRMMGRSSVIPLRPTAYQRKAARLRTLR